MKELSLAAITKHENFGKKGTSVSRMMSWDWFNTTKDLSRGAEQAGVVDPAVFAACSFLGSRITGSSRSSTSMRDIMASPKGFKVEEER